MVPNANSQFSQFPPNSNRNSRRLPRQRQRQRRIQKREADLNTDYHVVYKRIQKDIQHSSDYGKFSRFKFCERFQYTNKNRKITPWIQLFFSEFSLVCSIYIELRPGGNFFNQTFLWWSIRSEVVVWMYLDVPRSCHHLLFDTHSNIWKLELLRCHINK